uniref:Required for excision 1-B domain containing n=1 Tax=Astatotilapia calliptera TaxID=8154 RepID=A0AAX7W3U8_ASTCA
MRKCSFRFVIQSEFSVPSDFKALIQRFYHLQSERVETYRLFEEGHEAYLRTGPHYDFDHYRQLVHEITQAFCGISKEVLEIKGRLHDEFDRPDLSEHIEKLQNKEKEKLELTAKLQLAKQQAQDQPEDQSCQEQIQEIKHKIIQNKEALSEIMQDFKYDSEECD